MSKPYKGAVVFVEGVHYPVKDEHADLARPLRVNPDGSYRDAEEGEPLHNDVHHQQDANVTPEITVAVGGKDIYPAGVSVLTEEAEDGLTYYLVDEDEQPQREHPLVWDSESQIFRAKGGA